jgi:hypothetical protein
MYEAAPSTKVSIGAPAGHREPGCPKEHQMSIFQLPTRFFRIFPKLFAPFLRAIFSLTSPGTSTRGEGLQGQRGP